TFGADQYLALMAELVFLAPGLQNKNKKGDIDVMFTQEKIIMMVGAFVILCLVMMAIGQYNGLIRSFNTVRYCHSCLDAFFKRRCDLIHNLVEAVWSYCLYEGGILKQLTEMRVRALSGNLPFHERDRLDAEMGRYLQRFIVQAENYPAVKACINYLQLQHVLDEVEEQISAARRTLASAVMDYNNLVSTFPSNLWAMLFGFRRLPWYEATEQERATPWVRDLLNGRQQ
ncbi:MAG: LemA family protein, partial [Syntrophales bacterium]|nr:LemA family protein [Syntrophales bacterium]